MDRQRHDRLDDAFDLQDEPAPPEPRRGVAGAFLAGFVCGAAACGALVATGAAERETLIGWRNRAVAAVAPFLPDGLSPGGPAVPERADWATLSPAQREAAARGFGYDGEVRDGKFARWLDLHLEKRAEFDRRFGAEAGAVSVSVVPPPVSLSPPPPPSPSPEPSPPVPVPDAVSERVDWATLSPAQREAAARGFGYDGEVRDGKFARWLDLHLEKRAEFDRRFGAAAVPSSSAAPLPPVPSPPPVPPPAPIAVSGRADWTALTAAQREAAARGFGYDGEVRDGKFARWLDRRPDKRAEFDRRFGTASVPASPSVPSPPVPPAPVKAAEAPPVPPAPVKAAEAPPVPPAPVKTVEAPPVPPAPVKAVEAPPVPPAPVKTAASPPVPPAPVKPPPPPPPAKASPAPSSGSGGFAVQVGSFQDRANAEAMVRRLTARGRQAYAADWTDGRGKTWRVVRVGPFASAAQARQAAHDLAEAGTPGQVTSAR